MNTKLPIFLAAFLLLVISANAQGWISSSRTFSSGTYNISGGASDATLTIPAGETVTFTGGGWIGGTLVVNGTLILNAHYQVVNTLVGPNAQLSSNYGITLNSNAVFDQGSTITIVGTSTDNQPNNDSIVFRSGSKFTTTVLQKNQGSLFVRNGASVTADSIALNAGSNFIAGTITSRTIHTSSTAVLECPGEIITQNLESRAAPDYVSGKGMIRITGNFISGKALTASSDIVLDWAGTGGGNPGKATRGTSSPCETILLVELGSLNAFIKNEQLQIDWNTVSETNNAEFIIDISTTGIDGWKTIGVVKSKAENGNSTAGMDYSYNISLSSALGMLAMTLLFGLFIPVGNKRKRIVLTLLAIAMTIGYYSCQKSQLTGETTIGEKIFVRLSQIDKDGTTKVLKIQEAVKK